MTSTSTEPIAPPHIDLGEVPPTDDIPEPARSLVATWQQARGAAERAGLDYLDARETAAAAHAQRQYDRDRALVAGQPDPGAGPEADAEQQAKANADRLARIAQHAHDDAARALVQVAPQAVAELSTDDRTKDVRRAAAQLTRALDRLAATAPAVGYYQRIIDAPKAYVSHVEYSSSRTVAFKAERMSVARFAELLATIEASPEQ